MKKVFYIIAVFNTIWSLSQNVETTLNKTKAKIGEEIILSIKTSSFSSDVFVFPKLDSIGKLEVINDYPIEYVKSNNTSFTIKKYGLTQFDKGSYEIPSINFQFNTQKKSTAVQKVAFEDVVLNDKKEIYDIKPNVYLDPNALKGNLPKLDFWHFGVFMGLALFLTILGGFLLKKFKFNKFFNQEAYIPPYQKFQNSLPTSFDDSKKFYSELTDSVRVYLSKSLDISTLEKTTNVLFQDFSTTNKEKNLNVAEADIQKLRAVFQNADLVKFAKSNADDQQLQMDLESVKSSILQIKNNIQQTKEEQIEIEKEQTRLAKIKLEKKKLRFSTFLIGVISLIVGIFVLGTSNIYDFLSYHFFTKDAGFYIEKPWISSNYGYPALKLETPEALERRVDSINGDKIQTFYWQTPKDLLSIDLQVFQMDAKKNEVKSPTQKDLQSIFGSKYTFKDILTTKFSTIKKVSGIKTEGSIEFTNEKNAIDRKFLVYMIQEPKGIFILKLTFVPDDSEIKNYIEKIENGLEIIDISPFENEEKDE